MGVFNDRETSHEAGRGLQGAPGVGFRLTADGNYDIVTRKLTNVGAPTSNADAATKKYVDDNSTTSTSKLTVDSNINMLDQYRIFNLKEPLNSHEPTTKNYTNTYYLQKVGGTMFGDLDMNGKNILNLPTPTNAKHPATKEYSDTKLSKGGGLMTGNIDMVNNRIYNLPNPTGPKQPLNLASGDFKYLQVNSSNYMLNHMNMNNKKIINLAAPTTNNDAATKKYVDDNSSSDLSPYFKKDGSVAMTGNINANNNKITNVGTPTANTDAATKKYVDDSHPDLSDYLEKDGTVAMTGNLNLSSNKIINVGEPTANTDVTTKDYVDKQVGNKPSHYDDQFGFLMSSTSQFTDESNGGNSFIATKIDTLLPQNGNFHTYNHKVLYYTINKNSQGGYKYKFSMNFYRLHNNTDYTLVLELLNTEYLLWHKSAINVTGGNGITLSNYRVNKLSYKYQNSGTKFMYYYKIVINFKKLSTGRHFIYIEVDIPQTGIDLNTYPRQFAGNYLVCYGINGTFSSIDVDKVYDYHTAFDIKPTEVEYNVDLDMNSKKILNIATDSSANSAATVGMINKIEPRLKFHVYRKYFKEFWDFSDAKCYNLVTSAYGAVFNSISSISGDVNKNITFPNKTIDDIYRGTLRVSSYVLSFYPPEDKNSTICLIFKIWTNRNWNFDKYDVRRNNNGNINRNSLMKVYYQNSDKKLYLNVNNTLRSLSVPNSFFGKNIVLWVTQNATTPITKVNFSNYSSELIINSAPYVNTQKYEFFNNDTEIQRIMYSSNFYDTNNVEHHTILLEEKLLGNFVD